MKNGEYSHLSIGQLNELISLESRSLMIDKAKKNMVDFCKIMMPDTCDPNDALKTEYDPAGHSRMLCDIVERFESGKSKRVAVSIPPQHGKPVEENQKVLMGDGSLTALKNIRLVTM